MDIGRGVYGLMNLFFRTRRLGPDGAPWREKLRGGWIIACNHTSFMDPLVLGAGFWYRRVSFLTGEVVMQGCLRQALLKGMGCIRIDRNISDLEGIRAAIDCVKDGRCLALFPEGGLTDGEGDHAIKGGAMLIAVQAGAPVLPVYLHKPKRRFGRWTMVVGEPLDAREACGRRFPSLADIERASDILRKRLSDCRDTYECWEGDKP